MSDFEPSSRRIFEQSWWIASELARRQSRLRVFESHFGGIYDELLVTGDVIPIEVLGTVNLNRAGSIHTHVAGDDGTRNLTWADAVRAESPYEIVHEIERRMGWGVRRADPTTPRSVTYRAISRLLTRNLNDRATWNVRQLFPDGWIDYPKARLQQEFPSAAGHYGDFAVGRPGLWAVQRDAEVVMVLGEDGRLHRAGESVALMPIYQQRKRVDDLVNRMLE